MPFPCRSSASSVSLLCILSVLSDGLSPGPTAATGTSREASGKSESSGKGACSSKSCLLVASTGGEVTCYSVGLAGSPEVYRGQSIRSVFKG